MDEAFANTGKDFGVNGLVHEEREGGRRFTLAEEVERRGDDVAADLGEARLDMRDGHVEARDVARLRPVWQGQGCVMGAAKLPEKRSVRGGGRDAP